ncbi:MAG: GFA family protein [Amaricoccus sp.]
MPTATYHGSCHCGAVRYEADIDLAAGTGKCNCSYCSKVRNWGAGMKPDAFRLLAGAEALADYQFGTHAVHHRFCRFCGIHTHTEGDIPEVGGPFVSVQLGTLDDAPIVDLAEAPVHFSNGRDNDWMNPPAETRHL